MLTMIHNESARSGLFSELGSQTSHEEEVYDQFSCPLHPGFKLQVLCPKENFHPPLLCIKCMIDPDIERQIKNEPLIAIHDVINKASTAPANDTYNERNRTLLKEKIVEFSGKDYLGSYERHTDAQMKKLQKEIDRVKDSLNELHMQFKEMFDKQYRYLKNREDDLKKKINEYIEDQERMEDFVYSSHDSIMETIRKTTNVREYEKIIKALYHKSAPNQKSMAGSLLNGVFDLMDDLKEKTNKMKNSKIQTSILDEIRQKIDSIELFDPTAQALQDNLAPKLMQTLEKIRQIEEKKKTPQKEMMHHQMTQRLPQKKADPLGALKERLANFGSQPNSQKMNKMEIENSSKLNELKKLIKVEERGTQRSPYHSQSTVKTDEKKQNSQSASNKKGKESTTQMFNMAGTNTGHDDDYHRMYDEDRTHRRQKVENDVYRRVSELKHREPERPQEMREQNRGEYDFAAEYALRDNYDHDHSAEPQSHARTNTSKAFPSSAKSRNMPEDSAHRNTSKKYSEGKHYNSQSQRDASLDGWVTQRQDRKEKPEKSHQPKEKSRKKSQRTEGDNDNPDHSNSQTPRRARVKGLHDWINRRVTGYLIFQNTMHDEGLEKEHEGDHLNRVAGEKWKSLSKGEKEEYRSLAYTARIHLKKEFRDVDIEDEHIKELQEVIEKKMKKVKKDFD